MEREVSILPPERYGYDFIPPEYLPAGKDEYWLRNRQAAQKPWRRLTADEVEALRRNGSFAADWDKVLVCDPFEPALIKNASFYGLVRIGVLRDVLLQHHDFRVPAGIRNSTLVSCDVGDDVSIQDCSLVSHYIIGDCCILSRIDELVTTNHSKFGSGVIKDGEHEDVRIWIDVMNEAGGRSILAFPEMICADAFLWACYRDDEELTESLKIITQESPGLSENGFAKPGVRGFYGTIGSGAVIKSCRIIKDTKVGEGAYIKGANKLKNITVLSSFEEAAQIGEGVELVNGIIGYGSHVFYGSKAVRFVLGRNCNLKYGARLIHSVLGDNSTVSCCEILNNLVFPVHEQHHNNSFLIASFIGGMSNMAAGATIGSNHNSRANDGEIRAGRGFWPGLSVTLKHPSRFASFCLIVKGDYPYELDIALPFSLVNNNVRRDRLEVMPAYFWMYNLYALERNSWKTLNRDKRRIKIQHIEADYLAPDTAEEIIAALGMIEQWMKDSGWNLDEFSRRNPAENLMEEQAGDQDEDPEYDYSGDGEVLPACGLERHDRPEVILKPRRAVLADREMLFYYGMKTALEYLEAHPEKSFAGYTAEMEAPAENAPGRITEWVNLGGQIAPAFRVDGLRSDIKTGKVPSWDAVHTAYDGFFSDYPLDKARHGWETLRWLENEAAHPFIRAERFAEALDKAALLQEKIAGQVYVSRVKDFHDPFRGITYRNGKEMKKVAGSESPFVKLAREKSAAFNERKNSLKKRLGLE
ncbi:MAG: DUF4954 family protein [Treponema sp.]|jgi:NDP-sugar pyrophosphorylase family protein|nr:DUF4954 family protein [Treponema sp.]